MQRSAQPHSSLSLEEGGGSGRAPFSAGCLAHEPGLLPLLLLRVRALLPRPSWQGALTAAAPGALLLPAPAAGRRDLSATGLSEPLNLPSPQE